jgi:hypothetical protein
MPQTPKELATAPSRLAAISYRNKTIKREGFSGLVGPIEDSLAKTAGSGDPCRPAN